MPVDSDKALREIFALEHVAVVGCSTTPGKDAHEVPSYLQRHGFDVIPVNPNAEEVLGRRSYNSLWEVEKPVEIVEVFRPSDEVAGIVDAALERNDVNVVWLQLGIHDNEAVTRAEDAGLCVAQDRCMKLEHRRLFGA